MTLRCVLRQPVQSGHLRRVKRCDGQTGYRLTDPIPSGGTERKESSRPCQGTAARRSAIKEAHESR